MQQYVARFEMLEPMEAMQAVVQQVEHAPFAEPDVAPDGRVTGPGSGFVCKQRVKHQIHQKSRRQPYHPRHWQEPYHRDHTRHKDGHDAGGIETAGVPVRAGNIGLV